jgi:hypothetical protein
VRLAWKPAQFHVIDKDLELLVCAFLQALPEPPNCLNVSCQRTGDNASRK